MNRIIHQDYARVRDEIRREITQRYAEQREQAGLWESVKLWLRIERETEQEFRRRYPAHVVRLASEKRP